MSGVGKLVYDISLNYLGVNPPLTPPRRGSQESGVNPPLAPPRRGRKKKKG
ncbi:MAG: hypothetical protein F6K18_12440 [Okeania sp. SIO2C2]|uniref:hypothetical protein n=1 Tax=Okeania sp. SIO2C2 TaxID=2607787 RepID=UPI0013B6FD5E|nr:hypothetical protein [Okeania sp. SIO2C2]NEP87560.1 hypothetical protein [Okeania sp. SIO2C2]